MMEKEKANGGDGFMLRDVLDKLGISQRKLAKMVGGTGDWIARIYHGRNAPSWPTVVKIARCLGVSVGVFADNDPARLHFFQRVHLPPEPQPPGRPRAKPSGQPRRRRVPA
jgi:transcriptional regulator with XRE-family HTH domain